AARLSARAACVDVAFRTAAFLPWRPCRCAEILVDGTVVGHAGELHPQVCERANIPARSIALEIDLDALPVEERFPQPKVSAFPPVYQDVALVVDEGLPGGEVQKVLREG